MAYQKLHPIKQLDFQINRILTYGAKACDINEVKESVKNINDLATWYEVWERLGSKAELEGRYLHAAYYFRLAEFFLTDKDPHKLIMYDKSIKNFAKILNDDKTLEIIHVPYETSAMKTFVFKASNEKGKLVIFGGYDSFIEEFYLSIKEIVDSGYSVYLFEGPGQGETLKCGLTFEPCWEKPVKAVLDFFKLESVTIIGISWGGYLALRAAAFEKRIAQVVAYDILYDGFDCMINPFPAGVKQLFKILFALRQKGIINAIIKKLMRQYLIIDWVVSHGQYITGKNSPYDFYMHLRKHTLKGITDRITCDVLLLAGEKDHYIPLRHYYILMKKLNNAHTLKGKIFTEAEGGEQHCQVGNHRLAINYIINWLERQ